VRREDERRRGGEKIGAVHLKGQVEEIGDLANLGARRLGVRTFGTPSHEVAR
jgi:hypothetical protein